MPFPDLTLAAGRTNESEATAAPDNGVNEFAHNWNLQPDQIVETAIDLEVQALGPSVTGATFVGLTADKLRLQVSFVQTGADSARVVAKHNHSITT